MHDDVRSRTYCFRAFRDAHDQSTPPSPPWHTFVGAVHELFCGHAVVDSRVLCDQRRLRDMWNVTAWTVSAPDVGPATGHLRMFIQSSQRAAVTLA
jgi:hypothetical protein